jgi:hypothetical protein
MQLLLLHDVLAFALLHGALAGEHQMGMDHTDVLAFALLHGAPV